MSDPVTKPLDDINDITCKATIWNLGGLLLGKGCKDYNKNKADAKKQIEESTKASSTEVVPASTTTPAPAPAPSTSTVPAKEEPVVEKKGGWFAQGGKRKKSKSKKSKRSKRSNRRQKSRKQK